MMGIKLSTSNKDSSQKRQWSILSILLSAFSFFILVFAVTVNCLSTVFRLKSSTTESFRAEGINITHASLLIVQITSVNNSVKSFAIYFLFYVFVFMGKWTPLWNVLEQIELQKQLLDRKCYVRSRIYAFIGLAYILIVICL